MDLLVNRRWYTDRSTVGVLRAGAFMCFTLEDRVHDGPKIPGATAIPAGRYRVEITFSNRFQRLMPLLLDVPGFTGIRIHAGNTDADTSGCILVGRSRGPDWIGSSREAYRALFGLIRDTQPDCWITIIDHREGPPG